MFITNIDNILLLQIFSFFLKKNKIMNLIYFNPLKKTSLISKVTLIYFMLSYTFLFAQRGYYDAPYKRYEANLGTLSNGAAITPKTYSQADIQSEASDQQCVNLTNANATIEWALIESADGLVIRYSVADQATATIGIYDGDTKVTSLVLTANWSWESLWNNGNPNNTGIANKNPKMRFDEVRYKLPAQISETGKLKLVLESGTAYIDFIELEPVPKAIDAPSGSVTYIGNGSTLQTFINSNGGKKIFIPSGIYTVNSQLYFGVANTSLHGAGMWHTQINFSNATAQNGGLLANAIGISFSDLYLTTNSKSRSNSYKAINGVYTSTSTIKNIWAEHFECGAWIAQYNTNGPSIADGFILSNCRFRNNYADGINLCKGTSNAIVEHCNFRNNGDDDQAIWCADGMECINNTFRFNTSENCWRASGLAIYGGKNNKAYNLIIKDNLEAGIRISNSFNGVGFNTLGNHELHDISIVSCGTFNDLYNNPVGSIDIFCASNAGTQVKNIKFLNIDIIDSKNDAIFLQKKSGDGIYNLSFENISANGTGKEFPYNNINNSTSKKGQFVLISNLPNGNGTYCNMNYSNRGGNAVADENTAGKGSFSWTQPITCTQLSSPKFDLKSISIYPNPVKNTLNLCNLNYNEQISIFDITGKLLFNTIAQFKTETINTSNLVNGLYIITLRNGENSKTTKFIKE